jgi:hypothetical protein
MTRWALRFQGACVIVDLVFRVAAGTVNVLGEDLRTGLLQSRHDQAGVDALLADLHLAHHAARA